MATESKMTFGEAINGYVAHLETIGKSAVTVRSYRGDLRLAARSFGADTPLVKLTAARVGKFLKSDLLTKRRDGSPKAAVGVERVKRVLRLMLVWAKDDTLPLPKSELKRGRRQGSATNEAQ